MTKLDEGLCARIMAALPADAATDTPAQSDLRALFAWAAEASQLVGVALAQLSAVTEGLAQIADPADPNQV